MVNAPDLAAKQAWLENNIDKETATKTFGNADWEIMGGPPGFRRLTIVYTG
jgi:hypothetical protein